MKRIGMPAPNTHEHLPRFYCPGLAEAVSADGTDGSEIAPPDLTGAVCELSKPESHHAKNVLRLSAGQAVELLDGRGAVASASLEGFNSGRAVCRIDRVTRHPRLSPMLTIASAVPKGPRADAMADQLSQLGVDHFIPLIAERSVAIPKDSKIEKFARAAVESAKQCGRAWLMEITEPSPPDEVWADGGYDLKLLAVPGGEALAEPLPQHKHVLVMIGPEGGWTDRERASARDAGCRDWTFAPHTLRIETAALAAAAVLRAAGLG